MFVKGKSGNPGGRPKALLDVMAAARGHGKEAIAALAQIVRSKKASESARVSAAIALLDRGYGKPAQFIEHHGDLTVHEGGIDAPPDIPTTREAWLARRQQQLAELTKPPGEPSH